MNIDLGNEAFFSPTGTTKRIVEAISQGVGASSAQKIDPTPPGDNAPRFYDTGIGIAIIGAPV